MTKLVSVLAVAALAAGCSGGGGKHHDKPDPLTVESVSPADATQDASVDTVIEVDFSAVLDPSTMANALTVETGSTPIAGETSVVGDGSMLRFTPDAEIGTLRSVDVGVATTLLGIDGEALESAYSFSFRTIPEGIRVQPLVIEGLAGSDVEVTAELYGDGGTIAAPGVTWTSSDEDVATVSGTTVSLLAAGTAGIMALVEGVSTSIPVLVADSTGRGSYALFTSADYHDHDGADDYHLFHVWDLTCLGAVDDGGSDQFDTVWAPAFSATPQTANTGTQPACPASITFDGPSAVIPGLLYEDAAAPTAGAINGLGSCHLRPGESYMYQDVTVGAPTTLALSWTHTAGTSLPTGFTETPSFNVTVENLTDGTAPVEVYFETPNDSIGPHVADLSLLGLSGKNVRVMFRFIGTGNDGTPYDGLDGAYIDDVSLLADATELLTNGGCETSTAGWTGSYLYEPREVNFGATTTVEGLTFTRSVYAPFGNGYWARVLDTYENPTGADIPTYLRMEGDLGSDNGGVTMPILEGRAFLTYDTTTGTNVGEGPDPIVVMIPGAADYVDVPTLTAEWSAEYDLNVPANGSISLLAFHVYGNANLESDVAFAEALAADIIDSIDALGAASPYAAGLTADELAGVVNWQ